MERDKSGKSCIGCRQWWVKRGGWRRHSPFAAKWSKKPATLTFTPFLPLEYAEKRQDFILQCCNVSFGKDLKAEVVHCKSHFTEIVFVCQVEPYLGCMLPSPPAEDKCVGVIVCNPWLSPPLTADLHKCGPPLNSPPSVSAANQPPTKK